jgi:hypothetical protein
MAPKDWPWWSKRTATVIYVIIGALILFVLSTTFVRP